jgi:hypothetical protein
MSNRRLKANHRNSQKSTGPRTDRGKARSSMNALKHGLRSTRALFPGESSEIFDIFRKSIFDLLEPEDLIQAHMTQEIVSSLWRLRRASFVEDQLFAYSADRVLSSRNARPDSVMGQAWAEYDLCFCRLRRYQVSIERSLTALLSNIRRLHGKEKMHRGHYQAQQAGYLLESMKLLQTATSGNSPVDIPKAFEERLSHVDDDYMWHPKPLSNQSKPVSPSTPKSSSKSVRKSPVRPAAPSESPGCEVSVAPVSCTSPGCEASVAPVSCASPGCSATQVPKAQEAIPQTSSLADKRSSSTSELSPVEAPVKPAESAPISVPAQPQPESPKSLSPQELAAKKEAEYLDWLRLANARRESKEMEKGRF